MKKRGRAAEVVEVEPVESERAESRDRFARLRGAAKAFDDFRPASEVLLNVRAVPTIFPQFDLVTRVGGLPVERFTLVHGSSAGGKSFLAIGLMWSFLMLDHPVLFLDAERTSPHTWMRTAMGDHADHPFFLAVKPRSFEHARDEVRKFLTTIKSQRDKGKLGDDATALVVVDSVRKLMPEDHVKQLLEEGKSEQLSNRSAQHKARLNAGWLDELVILLDETKTAMVAIAREMVDPNNTNPKAIRYGTNVKTGGGSSLFYDASLDLRVSRTGRYGKKGSGDEMQIYGDVHRVDITKTKVSGRGEDYRTSAVFHISNGAHVPEGFDRWRDVAQLARRLHVIEGTRGLTYRKHKWRSEDAAVLALCADPLLFAEVGAECRAAFPRQVVTR